MSTKKERLPRLVAAAQAVDAYEERFGVISVQELKDQVRADRASAVVLRGNRAARTGLRLTRAEIQGLNLRIRRGD